MKRSVSPVAPTPRGSASAGNPAITAIPPQRHDLRILRAIRRIIRSADQHSRRLALDHGVTVPQLLCLTKVVEAGRLSVKEIAREIYLGSSTLVGILDRLEKSGYVRRERAVRDRRQVMITPTDAGREVVRRSPSPLQQNLVRALERLPGSERAEIAQALERVVEMLEITQVPAAPILETARDLAQDTARADSSTPRAGERGRQ